MLISLVRYGFTPEATVGRLLVDRQPFCDTLEPPVVPNALHPKGAIPVGWYRLTLTYSPKFKRVLPLLHHVPRFEGIRIHAGNRKEDTQGCLLVGVRGGQSLQLTDARRTEEALVELLNKLQDDRQEIYIEVTDSERYAVERLSDTAPYGYRLCR